MASSKRPMQGERGRVTASIAQESALLAWSTIESGKFAAPL